MTNKVGHREFLEKALDAAAAWTRYGDPKALAVLVLLGLGLSDLLDKAGALTKALDGPLSWALFASLAFWLAVLLAFLAVVFVSLAVFPRIREGDLFALQRPDPKRKLSLFYFGDVAESVSADAYFEKVIELDDDQITRQLSDQVWAVASIAKKKHVWTQRAYVVAVCFLVSWAASRLCFALG